jgi:hypothetical protein
MLETSPALEAAGPTAQGARPLGELLVAKGLLTDEQLRWALAEQAESGRLLGEIVVQRDLISMVALVNALVEQLREARKVSYSNALQLPILSGMTKVDFPWRPLGEILVERGFIVPRELEAALAEQQRTGRKLGEILVDQGALTGSQLTRVLVEQTGLRFEDSAPEAEPFAASAEGEPWRPLGRVLVDRGVITEAELEEALHVQRETGRRLGEILVERGAISGADLARALGEQHGLEPESFAIELETSLKPAQTDEPVYRVYSVTFRQGFQERAGLSESANFLEAADFAMEYVQEHSPEALEIERIHGDEQETVWAYSESRAAAAQAARKDLVDTFGFDPTRWNVDR